MTTTTTTIVSEQNGAPKPGSPNNDSNEQAPIVQEEAVATTTETASGLLFDIEESQPLSGLVVMKCAGMEQDPKEKVITLRFEAEVDEKQTFARFYALSEGKLTAGCEYLQDVSAIRGEAVELRQLGKLGTEKELVGKKVVGWVESSNRGKKPRDGGLKFLLAPSELDQAINGLKSSLGN
jgi:hypothetical protein